MAQEKLSPLASARQSPQSPWTQRLLWILGIVVLIGWGVEWNKGLSARIPYFPRELKTWVAPFPFIGLDFVHNYAAGRTWIAGADPYLRIIGDPQYTRYGYAPEVLPFFSWCIFLQPDLEFVVPSPPVLPGSNGYMLYSSVAVRLWALAIAAFSVLAATLVWQFRKRLPIAPVPLVLMWAAVLASTPVILEMERGNCNVLALILLVVSIVLIDRKPSLAMDIVAAICLAFAIWIKSYIVFAPLAIIAARRYRLIPICTIVGLLMAGLWWRETLIFVTSLRKAVAIYEIPLMPTLHSLVIVWPQLVQGTPLALIPPLVAGILLILVPMLLLMYVLWRSKKGAALLLPAALWCTAMGTYLPHVSHDYNYASFLLLALAVWDRRDPFWVHALMGIALLWWQPFEVALSPHVIFWGKLFSLYAMGYCLLRRAYELEALENHQPTDTISVFKQSLHRLKPSLKPA